VAATHLTRACELSCEQFVFALTKTICDFNLYKCILNFLLYCQLLSHFFIFLLLF